ncbi:hypothetical protein RQM47_09175 [Rubrivirga sp. S365]|uniref:Uncharacterized protein n=1 Tax=Rubrivirga litoralis TaxID=3075598 RepID=A0ABU3BSC6_9BACT|nr:MULTISPECIES: hypothetical protein [unclassified Rubrivirga]MDT0632200.1 hypothetical protein [Rubrivirga sp. F394]MDT7856810.1 hypothetical protein [Rubrivirga sp. S365]
MYRPALTLPTRVGSAVVLLLALARPAPAQEAAASDGAEVGGAALHDEVVAWRTYSDDRAARVRVFASGDERRPVVAVVDDRAANGGAVTDEAAFVADLVGRALGFDPVAATFVFRFTPAAFVEGAADGGKTLLLQATFRRTASGGLGSPSWRVLTPDRLDALTDRGLR